MNEAFLALPLNDSTGVRVVGRSYIPLSSRRLLWKRIFNGSSQS